MKRFFLAGLMVALSARLEAQEVIALEDAIKIAKEQPALAQANAQVEIAALRAEQIKLGKNPQVDLSAVISARPFFFNNQIDENFRFLVPTYSASIDARWLLYDFGKIEGRFNAADGATIATSREVDILNAQITFGVAQSYYGLWVAQETVVLTEAALVKVQARVETAQALFDAGARPKIEVARAKLDQANAEVDKARSLGEATRARTALAAAMGLFGVRYSASRPSDLPAPPPMSEAIERAYQARPELASLEAQRQAQELQIKSLKLNKKPDLIGAASVSALGPIVREDIFIPLFPNYSAQLIFSMPLYDGGVMAGQIALARAELKSIDAQMEQLKLDVSRSIEDAYTAYQTAVAARLAAEEATKFAIENEELAKGRYNAGAGSAIEISDAEVALVQAQSFELQARANEGLARLQIEFVLGVLGAK